MYECTYEHTYHYYLLSKVIFKHERKLVGTCVRVYISTYVCIDRGLKKYMFFDVIIIIDYNYSQSNDRKYILQREFTSHLRLSH